MECQCRDGVRGRRRCVSISTAPVAAAESDSRAVRGGRAWSGSSTRGVTRGKSHLAKPAWISLGLGLDSAEEPIRLKYEFQKDHRYTLGENQNGLYAILERKFLHDFHAGTFPFQNTGGQPNLGLFIAALSSENLCLNLDRILRPVCPSWPSLPSWLWE